MKIIYIEYYRIPGVYMGIEWISVIFHDMKIPGGSYVLKLGSMATSSSPPDEFANVIQWG